MCRDWDRLSNSDYLWRAVARGVGGAVVAGSTLVSSDLDRALLARSMFKWRVKVHFSSTVLNGVHGRVKWMTVNPSESISVFCVQDARLLDALGGVVLARLPVGAEQDAGPSTTATVLAVLLPSSSRALLGTLADDSKRQPASSTSTRQRRGAVLVLGCVVPTAPPALILNFFEDVLKHRRT